MPSRAGQPEHGTHRSSTELNGSVRGHVVEIQRARLLGAAGRMMCEHGAASVTVGQIVECAGVSRRTFYEIFSDCQDCVQAVLADALERARVRVLAVWSREGSWRERLRNALTELLCLGDEDPVLARLLVVESTGAGRQVLEQRARVLAALIDAVEDGRDSSSTDARPARIVAEGAVGGVLSVLHSRIAGDETPGRLVELTGPLMSMLVLPYEGLAAARRELARPVRTDAPPQEETPAFDADPFKAAGMRLTYRTMCVLEAIADRPGSSNRTVGQLAEIGDQGQVSKLLRRLERLGLIVNGDNVPGRGEPNAWSLTSIGRQVIDRIGAHTNTQRTGK